MPNNDKKGLVLIGGGGHCRSIIDLIESIDSYSISMGGKISIAKIVDKKENLNKHVVGEYFVNDTMDNLEDIAKYYKNFVIAFGQLKTPNGRPELAKKITRLGGKIVTLISPYARVSPFSVIGEGTVIMHHAVVNANALVGIGSIINTGACVEHDANVGNFTHVSTNAVVNGGSTVGSYCLIGSNAVVLNSIKVSDKSVVGAGSVVIKNISDSYYVWVGNPARKIKINKDYLNYEAKK